MIGVFAHFPSTKASQVQYAALLFVVRVAYRLLRFITHATVTEADLGPAVAAERTVVTDQLWQLLRDCSASLDLAVIHQCVTVTCTLSTQDGACSPAQQLLVHSN